MGSHHFISYSSADAQPFAFALRDALCAATPPFPVWLDKTDLRPGEDWDDQIVEAIRRAESVIFLMTRDSVARLSVCKDEWSRALKYKKPVIPLLFHADAEVPFRLENRQYIDCAGGLESAFPQLCEHLAWMSTPEGQLRELDYRLADAERSLRRARSDAERTRAQEEVALLQTQIARLREVIENPRAAREQVEVRVRSGLEREAQPAAPRGEAPRRRFINPPPGTAPSYFQDRAEETRLVTEFLKDEARCLLTVVGRGGVGKTSLVCRLLKSLETGELPDGLGRQEVEGIVYLSAAGARGLNASTMFDDLRKLLARERAEELEALTQTPLLSTTHKMQALVAAFGADRIVLLLDNFEDLIDPATREIADRELDDMLRAVLSASGHGVKVIVTTRVAPRGLALHSPARQLRVDLDQGLPSPYAERILRAMDPDGKLGLKTASDELLGEVRERTRGYPRALEALVAILSADRDTTLADILADTRRMLPDHVVEALVGEAYSRLDGESRKVMQALAAYGRPVAPVAVDYLLQPYWTGVDSAPVLARLVNMQFVRREAGRYGLHPVDRAYALDQIPRGEPGDRRRPDPPYTQFALRHRAADFFKHVRRPRDSWHSLDDLAPHLNEIELRIAGEDFETAAVVLDQIDMEYLFRWGYYRRMIEMHEPLQGKLANRGLKITSLANLGSAYAKMGKLHNAIEHQEAARRLARESGDRRREADLLNRLGLRYHDLGQTARAIELYQQALRIESQLGQVSLAVTMNLGRCYADLAEFDQALGCYQAVLEFAERFGVHSMVAITQENLGHLRLDLGDSAAGIEAFERALAIADEHHLAQIQNWARWGLALAQLYAGRLADAMATCRQAREYRVPENDHRVAALLGQLRLLDADPEAAREAFCEAATRSDEFLANCDRVYHALDCKGLALCGLALCGQAGALDQAIEAFHAARQICRDPATVARTLRQLDAYPPADPKALLTPARSAAAGS